MARRIRKNGSYQTHSKARVVVTCVLMAVMLSCPYLCLGQRAQDAPASGDATCACCDRSRLPSEREAPEHRDDKQPDCLCHGAIVEGARLAPETALSDAFMTQTMDLARDTGAIALSSEASIDRAHPCHFPPVASGREICALCGSLLL